ncbi:clavesin-2-like [Phlebotomus argentipes]|uniref:clavesin-2-like n=1 Tax=Phlebotomus argentipes TaxID=94469 RepID=UPI002892C6E8|nr:clavesin-2-like [Phlebotomus argentipes]
MDKTSLNARDDENLRAQALNQFREWISKHPQIRKCRTDDQFLLRFLRARKFCVTEACQLLVNYLSRRKMLPSIFENLDFKSPEIDFFIQNKSVYILPEVDKHGRNVLFFDVGQMDPKQCTALDCLRMCNVLFEHLSIDARSQTNGVVKVVDCTNEEFAFVAMWTPAKIKEFSQCWQKTFPISFAKIYLVNMPSFANVALNLFKTFISNKLKERIKTVNGWQEVFDDLGRDIFPEEIGGKTPSAKIDELFKKNLLETREEILAIGDLDIEVSNTAVNFGNSYDADLDTAIVGSFRKISVD